MVSVASDELRPIVEDRSPVHPDPTTLCRVLVGLPDVDVLDVTVATDIAPMMVDVASTEPRPGCGRCATPASVH